MLSAILVSSRTLRTPVGSVAIGFSQKICLPALIAVSRWAGRKCGGVQSGIGIGVFTFCYEKDDFASFFVAGRHCWHDHLLYLQRGADRFGDQRLVGLCTRREPIVRVDWRLRLPTRRSVQQDSGVVCIYCVGVRRRTSVCQHEKACCFIVARSGRGYVRNGSSWLGTPAELVRMDLANDGLQWDSHGRPIARKLTDRVGNCSMCRLALILLRLWKPVLALAEQVSDEEWVMPEDVKADLPVVFAWQ